MSQRLEAKGMTPSCFGQFGRFLIQQTRTSVIVSAVESMNAKRAHTNAPLVALFVVKMSLTLSVATPALLTEKAAETQPPNSIGIVTMS